MQNEVPLQAAAPRAERDQARVSVQVRDVNEAPVFQENPLRTSLAEGAAPGTPVATFSARDPDTQQLQRLRCLPGTLRVKQRELITHSSISLPGPEARLRVPQPCAPRVPNSPGGLKSHVCTYWCDLVL